MLAFVAAYSTPLTSEVLSRRAVCVANCLSDNLTNPRKADGAADKHDQAVITHNNSGYNIYDQRVVAGVIFRAAGRGSMFTVVGVCRGAVGTGSCQLVWRTYQGVVGTIPDQVFRMDWGGVVGTRSHQVVWTSCRRVVKTNTRVVLSTRCRSMVRTSSRYVVWQNCWGMVATEVVWKSSSRSNKTGEYGKE